MKLATIRTAEGTRAVRVEADTYVGLDAADVGELLRRSDWTSVAQADLGATYVAATTELAPVIVHPAKVVCVGLNYRSHILEMGREPPEYPTLFTKFPEAIIGPRDDIALAPESSLVDWEAELAVVIGKSVRRADPQQAAAAIAGFTVMNDVTMRDFQYRTTQWFQGKTFEATTPLGPVLVTPDEVGGVAPALTLTASVNGEEMQRADTSDLVFGPVALVEYISRIVTLNPGDVIATGTPGGVGHARKPPRRLGDGDVVVTEVAGIGRLVNQARTP